MNIAATKKDDGMDGAVIKEGAQTHTLTDPNNGVSLKNQYLYQHTDHRLVLCLFFFTVFHLCVN